LYFSYIAFVNAFQCLKNLCFWWICFWRLFASDESASDELAFDDVIFRSSFFRRILTLIFQERFSVRCSSSFSFKFLCSLIYSIRTFCKYNFDNGPAHLNKCLAYPIDNFLILCYHQNFKWYTCETPFVPTDVSGHICSFLSNDVMKEYPVLQWRLITTITFW